LPWASSSAASTVIKRCARAGRHGAVYEGEHAEVGTASRSELGIASKTIAGDIMVRSGGEAASAARCGTAATVGHVFDVGYARRAASRTW